jgi:hypothetical protein
MPFCYVFDRIPRNTSCAGTAAPTNPIHATVLAEMDTSFVVAADVSQTT